MAFEIQHLMVDVPGARIAVRECGAGEAVVMVPSWGRGGDDFDELAVALAEVGYHAIAVNLRGIDGSTGTLTGIDARTLASDVAGVIRARTGRGAHVIGHAMGNGIARCVATDHPALARTVTLIGAGGRYPPWPGAVEALSRALTGGLDDESWLREMRAAGFFARGFDPMKLRDGWWADVARQHQTAFLATPTSHWWAAGGAPILAIQGLEDGIAVPENGHALREEFGARVEVVDLADAGHALLPEKPDEIAAAIIRFLRANPSV